MSSNVNVVQRQARHEKSVGVCQEFPTWLEPKP